MKIVDLLLQDLGRRMEERQLSFTVTDDAKRFIVDSGFDPVYGARPLKRFIQHKVETLIAKEIIGKDLAPGTAMEIYLENGALAIREK